MASKTQMERYLAAAVQMSSGADRTANLARAEALVREAAGRGARLVVLPEVFAWRGPRAEEAAVAEPIPGPTTERLAALAREPAIHLSAGSLLEKTPREPRAYNTSCLFDPRGALVARYRKLHLFDVDLPGRVSVRESATRAPGDDVVAVPTALGTLGLSICYDLRFPELYRRLVRAGAEVLLAPSAFTFPTGAAHWEVLCRARATENQCYLVAPDQTGTSPHGFADYGESLIVDPWGRIFALLYLRDGPVALEEIASELEQSKSNVSVNIRGLVDWHLVRRTRVGGSRKDHYEAATDFWRVLQEIMERRFRWNVRQVLAAAAEAERAAAERGREARPFVAARLGALRAFFAAIDAGIGAFTQGKPLDPEALRNVLPLTAARAHQRR